MHHSGLRLRATGRTTSLWRSDSQDSPNGALTWNQRDLSGKSLRTCRHTGSLDVSSPASIYRYDKDYLYGPLGMFASYSAAGEMAYFHNDHLGSPRLITNQHGQAIGRHHYYPFGDEVFPGTPCDDRICNFTGHERDPNQGTDLLRQDSDNREAIDLVKRAASEGHTEASYALGTWFLHGFRVRRNLTKGADLIEIAARDGFRDAQYDLAVCFATGKGRKKDLSRAFRWYCTAAESGDLEAAFEVGWFLKEGEATHKDEKKALVWFRKAALGGVSEAQYALGWAYEYGKGLRRNRNMP